MIVYMLINKINNKKYVGQTVQPLKERIRRHESVKGCPMIYRAIKKYGLKNFDVEVLCECESREKLNDMEKYFIKYYKTTNKLIGYNLADGGEGMSGFRHTVESKQKMSEANSGDKHPLFGKRHSTESKLKMSKAQKDRLNKTDHPMLGRTHSTETKLKLRKINEGKELNEETKNKLRKCYVVVTPANEEIIVHGLDRFCKGRSLCLSSMIRVSTGKVSHHKGYWCRKLE